MKDYILDLGLINELKGLQEKQNRAWAVMLTLNPSGQDILKLKDHELIMFQKSYNEYKECSSKVAELSRKKLIRPKDEE